MARKYSYNINKIKIDSHEKYYWLGFIAGDGSVQEQGRRLRIELKDDSIHLLEDFRAFLESNAEIKTRTNNNGCHCAQIDINSKELGIYLAQYNIVPNKTKIFTIPEDKIPQEYMMDFLRGLIDADGCIHIRSNRKNLPSLSFVSGNKICVEQVAKLLNITNKITEHNGNYTIAKEGIGVKEILNKLYEHSTETTRLKRKYELYCTIVEQSTM